MACRPARALVLTRRSSPPVDPACTAGLPPVDHGINVLQIDATILDRDDNINIAPYVP